MNPSTSPSCRLVSAIALIGFLSIIPFADAQQIKLAPGSTWNGTVPATKVTIHVDATGKMTVVVDPSTPVTITGGGGGPTVPPPVDPPGTPVGIEAAAKKLTTDAITVGGSSTTAAGISAIYSLIGDAVNSGQTKPEDASQGVAFLTEGLLQTRSDRDKWAAFKVGIGKELDTLSQDGLLKTKEQVSASLKKVAAGINAAIGFSGPVTMETLKALSEKTNLTAAEQGILDKIDIKELIELIKFIMEIWKLFQAQKVGFMIEVLQYLAANAADVARARYAASLAA